MRHEFFPALVPYVIRVPKKIRKAWRHPTHWLNPEWVRDFHSTSLISYAHWRTHREWDWVTDRHVLFGDSGGYSVVTRNEQVDPERVMRWQIRRCHRGVMLDIPPYSRGSKIQFSGSAAQYWTDSLTKSMRNVRRALPTYREQDRFKWWGVVQGETLNQMREWHGNIAEIYPFDAPGEGWALAPKPSTSIPSTVRYLRFAREAGLRKVHLLQVTKISLVGIAFALGHLSDAFDLITYDSASATRCAINRTCIITHGPDMTFIRQLGNGHGAVHDAIMGHPSSDAEYYREAFPLDNDEWPYYVLLWNHHQMIDAFEAAFDFARRDPQLALEHFAGKHLGTVMREWEGKTRPKSQTRTVSLFDRMR